VLYSLNLPIYIASSAEELQYLAMLPALTATPDGFITPTGTVTSSIERPTLGKNL
jgi:hypothetical protein